MEVSLQWVDSVFGRETMAVHFVVEDGLINDDDRIADVQVDTGIPGRMTGLASSTWSRCVKTGKYRGRRRRRFLAFDSFFGTKVLSKAMPTGKDKIG